MKTASKLDRIRPEDYFRLPLIGKDVMIIESKAVGDNLKLKWCKIIDETRNTFLIDCEGKKKRVIKKSTWFKFKLYGKIIKIYGDILIGRPEERIKKRLPKPYKVLW